MRAISSAIALSIWLFASVGAAQASVISIDYAGTYSGSSTYCDFITGCETTTTNRAKLELNILFDTNTQFGTLTVTSTSSSFFSQNSPAAASVSGTLGEFSSFLAGSDTASAGTTSQFIQSWTISKTISNTPSLSITVNNPAIPASILQPFAIVGNLNGSGDYLAPLFDGNTGYYQGYYSLSLDSMIVSVDGVMPVIPQAVPEPSTWAMMMLGFAGIGFLTRRRQNGGGVVMRSVIVAAVLLAASLPSRATTYNYVGTGGTYDATYNDNCSSMCDAPYSIIQGSMSFGFDTRGFSGVHALAAGDSGYITGPISYFAFPESSSWFNPPYNTYGIVSQFSGDFEFLSGAIVGWSISGYDFLVGCGAGPGCSYGTYFSSGPSGDLYTSYTYPSTHSYRSSGPGSWSAEAISSVPETSTWAMLLLGFCGVGLIFYRRHEEAFPTGTTWRSGR